MLWANGAPHAQPRPARDAGDTLHGLLLRAADLLAVVRGDTHGPRTGTAAPDDLFAGPAGLSVAEAAASEHPSAPAAGRNNARRDIEERGLCDGVHRQVAPGRKRISANRPGI